MFAGNVIHTAVQNARTKKEIRAIYSQATEANFQNRSVSALPSANKQQLLLISKDPNDNDIYDYQTKSPSPAFDYIWGENDDPASMIVSGGQNESRIGALMPFVRKSQNADISVIAMHTGNRNLETMLGAESGNWEFISRSDLYYDMFRGMPVEDMAYLLYETMPDDSASPAAESLIRSLLEMVLRTTGTVTFQNLATFPLPDLKDKLETMQKAGEVTADEYREISRYYMSGSSEIDAVRIFLNRLNRQAEGIYGKPTANICNIKKVLNLKGIVAIDVGNTNNDLVFSLIVNHLRLLQSQGRIFSMLLDDIPVSRFPQVNDLLRGVTTYAISHNDFISSLHGGEKNSEGLFIEISGNVNTIILFNHKSGASCQKWSEHLGKYRKIRIKTTVSQTSSFFMGGNTRGISVDEVDEPRIRAETISMLPGSLACINSSSGTLIAEI